MFVTRMLWGLCLGALVSAAVSAADEPFVAEGLADPAPLAAKTAGQSAPAVEQQILAQATINASLHLGAYTHGVIFVQQLGLDGRFGFVTAGAEFLHLRGLSPETGKLRMLKSGLGLASVTYGADSIALLKLPTDLFSLPVYRVKGEYQNTGEAAMSKVALHWKAAGEAYHAALVEHLAKLYPGREIVSVKGRVFPVRVIEAELVPVAAPAGASAVASGAAAPANVSSAASGSAATTAPVATSTAAAQSASSATKAVAPVAFDSKQYVYRVEMDVRIRVDEVKFAEEKAATSAASAVSAASAAPAASAVPAAAP